MFISPGQGEDEEEEEDAMQDEEGEVYCIIDFISIARRIKLPEDKCILNFIFFPDEEERKEYESFKRFLASQKSDETESYKQSASHSTNS